MRLSVAEFMKLCSIYAVDLMELCRRLCGKLYWAGASRRITDNVTRLLGLTLGWKSQKMKIYLTSDVYENEVTNTDHKVC